MIEPMLMFDAQLTKCSQVRPRKVAQAQIARHGAHLFRCRLEINRSFGALARLQKKTRMQESVELLISNNRLMTARYQNSGGSRQLRRGGQWHCRILTYCPLHVSCGPLFVCSRATALIYILIRSITLSVL